MNKAIWFFKLSRKNNKFIYSLLAAPLLILLSFNALAAPDIGLGSATGSPGDTVYIPVTYTSQGTIDNLEFILPFDAVALSLDPGAVAPGAALLPFSVIISEILPVGHYRGGVIGPDEGLMPTIPTGEILILPFTIAVDAAAGTYPLTPSSVDYYAGGASISAGGQINGLITVTPLPGIIGGTVSGLPIGLEIELQNNDEDDLSITNNGDFSFDTALNEDETYDVTVLVHPSNHKCVVSNGTGTVGADESISDIEINCYSLGDCTDDSIIDTLDVVCAIGLAKDPSLPDLFGGDVDRDGDVESDDVNDIIEIILSN